MRMDVKWLFCQIATLGPVGHARFAPGSFGSLAAMFIAMGLWPWLNPIAAWIIVLAACLLGWLAANIHEQETQTHDNKSVVIDELAGLWLCYVFFTPDLFIFIIGLVYFRFFDILKPWPISYIDKNIKGGLGTVLDDLLAGLAAAFCVWATLYFMH